MTHDDWKVCVRCWEPVERTVICGEEMWTDAENRVLCFGYEHVFLLEDGDG